MPKTPSTLRIVVALLILMTSIRFLVVSFQPSLEMFGGPNPHAWIGPWGADTVLGALAPVMAWMAWRGYGARVWGSLIAYNSVGAFDYSHGLLTQWLEPSVTQPALMIYAPIGISLIVQLAALGVLFRSDVATSFSDARDPAESTTLRQNSYASLEETSR